MKTATHHPAHGTGGLGLRGGDRVLVQVLEPPSAEREREIGPTSGDAPGTLPVAVQRLAQRVAVEVLGVCTLRHAVQQARGVAREHHRHGVEHVGDALSNGGVRLDSYHQRSAQPVGGKGVLEVGGLRVVEGVLVQCGGSVSERAGEDAQVLEDSISVDVEGGVVAAAETQQEGAGVFQSMRVEGHVDAVEATTIVRRELTVVLHVPVGVVVVREHPRGRVHLVREQPVAVSLDDNGCYPVMADCKEYGKTRIPAPR